MKPMQIAAVVSLWLFTIGLGLDLGGGFYEARIVVPLWAHGVPDTLAAGDPYGRVAIDAGMNFWAYVTSAVAFFALLALVTGAYAPAPQRVWQIAASGLELVAVAMTLLYFRPTLVRLFMGHGSGMTTASVQATVRRWVSLSRLRIAISAAAWFAALYALKLT